MSDWVSKVHIEAPVACAQNRLRYEWFTAAKKFASMNPAKLILACRSQARGDEAAACTSFQTPTPIKFYKCNNSFK
jgi:hypothetical protein